MPTEIRRIVFLHTESTAAIIAYGQRFNMSFPQGKIIRASFTNKVDYESLNSQQFQSPTNNQYNVEQKPRAVIITFFDEKSLEHKFVNLTSDFISGALIEYCVNNKIMIPKTSRKSLDITEFNLCLDIHIEQIVDPNIRPLVLDD